MTVNAQLQSLLHEKFGFRNFRLGQEDVIKSVIAGHDTMAIMPTGRGKSLCYQLPALYKKGITVVISPLVSLMRDQVRGLKDLGIEAGCLYSGQDMDEKRRIFSAIKTSPSFILIVSPERVQKDGFAQWIQKQPISLFAIDEAHCISQWGPDFREDYQKLQILRQLRPDVPILGLTATATPEVLNDIIKQLGLKNPDRHVYGFYRPNLFYQTEVCDNTEEKMGYLRAALKQTPEGRVIVYCGTRKQTEELVETLGSEFKDMGFYHAGLSEEKRSKVQNDYENRKIRILAATNAFGMGIDHPDVRLVVHFQMPANIEFYYQEVGRAGRDGNPSSCLLLYAKKDKGLHSYFITQSDASSSVISRRWRSLDAIVQFIEGGECRHSGILTYFRDSQRIPKCGHCDICDPSSSRKVQKPEMPKYAGSFSSKGSGGSLSKSGKSSKKSSKALAAKVSESALSDKELVRVEVLKAWRKSYADEKDIPAFMVFSNKTLNDLAVKNPKKTDDLEKVYGLGPHKIEHLGSLILEQLRET